MLLAVLPEERHAVMVNFIESGSMNRRLFVPLTVPIGPPYPRVIAWRSTSKSQR
jgi:hypothetical protein